MIHTKIFVDFFPFSYWCLISSHCGPRTRLYDPDPLKSGRACFVRGWTGVCPGAAPCALGKRVNGRRSADARAASRVWLASSTGARRPFVCGCPHRGQCGVAVSTVAGEPCLSPCGSVRFYFLHFQALFFGASMFIITTCGFIIIKCTFFLIPSIFVLKSVFSDVSIAIPALFRLLFAWDTCSHPLTFNLSVSLNPKSYRQHSKGVLCISPIPVFYLESLICI